MKNYNIINTVIDTAKEDFQYGKLDCAIFAGDVAKKLYGIEIVDRFKYKYSNIKEALKYLKEHNYSNLVEAVSGELDQDPVTVDDLKSGDIVAIRSRYRQEKILGYALGVVYEGYGLFIRESGNRIQKIPLDACVCGWNL